MNVGTPVRYIDADDNEWVGIIVGREWDHHWPYDPKTGLPNGEPAVRNETGRFNCVLWGHDFQHMNRTVNPGELLPVDGFGSTPIFAQHEPFSGRRAAPAPAAPAPGGPTMGELNAAMDAKFALMVEMLSAKLAPPAKPRAKRTAKRR